MGKRAKRYDRSKPLSHPTRRQFALRVLREREAESLAAMQADPVHVAHVHACMARIRQVLDGAGGARES